MVYEIKYERLVIEPTDEQKKLMNAGDLYYYDGSKLVFYCIAMPEPCKVSLWSKIKKIFKHG